jgi:hypothetical protein
MFTLVMSTFWLNSGGNLVFLRSFASTGVAIFASEEREGEMRRVVKQEMKREKVRWTRSYIIRAVRYCRIHMEAVYRAV